MSISSNRASLDTRATGGGASSRARNSAWGRAAKLPPSLRLLARDRLRAAMVARFRCGTMAGLANALFPRSDRLPPVRAALVSGVRIPGRIARPAAGRCVLAVHVASLRGGAGRLRAGLGRAAGALYRFIRRERARCNPLGKLRFEPCDRARATGAKLAGPRKLSGRDGCIEGASGKACASEYLRQSDESGGDVGCRLLGWFRHGGRRSGM